MSSVGSLAACEELWFPLVKSAYHPLVRIHEQDARAARKNTFEKRGTR